MLLLDFNIFAREAGAARGIAAEPPKREIRSMSAKVMERIARRERTHKWRSHAVEVREAARPNH
jgi:hypothetical protein